LPRSQQWRYCPCLFNGEPAFGTGVRQAASATMAAVMKNLSRRDFLLTAAAATLASAAAPALASTQTKRVFVASGSQNGILAYDWDPVSGELTAAGVGAGLAHVDWLTFGSGKEFVFAAVEVNSFNGKPTGEVASLRLRDGKLTPVSAQNSASVGTCHVAVDQTGRMAVAADYGGGSAASFQISDGRLSPAVWTEHYTKHGPNPDRQQSAHAHFVSFSQDNRFVYINDLGGDCIHIYRADPATAGMTPAGTYEGAPGSGPRTLHFHPNGHTAYCVNEIVSTVDVLEWHKTDGSLTLVTRIDLLPADYHGPTRACDTVISRDGRFVYFLNRDDNFVYSFRADPKTGSLMPMARTNCGGKTPRNFVLDPSEHWMVVANQDSNLISVFARNPETGTLANEGKSIAAATPMRILFT
jgi:6-phosphogluconolactonase